MEVATNSTASDISSSGVKCRDVEALQDLAIRLFAENQGRTALYEDLLWASHWPNRASLSLRTCICHRYANGKAH